MVQGDLCLNNTRKKISLLLVSSKYKIISMKFSKWAHVSSYITICCVAVKQSRAGLVVQGTMSWEVVQIIPYKSSNYEEPSPKLCWYGSSYGFLRFPLWWIMTNCIISRLATCHYRRRIAHKKSSIMTRDYKLNVICDYESRSVDASPFITTAYLYL